MEWASNSSRIRGVAIEGPYSAMDMRLGWSSNDGSRFNQDETPSTSNPSSTTHWVSPGHIPDILISPSQTNSDAYTLDAGILAQAGSAVEE